MSPDEQPERDVVIRVKRETLILAASLLFLGLAILLAVMFPGGSSGSSAATSTSLALRTTSQAVAQIPRATTVGAPQQPAGQDSGTYPGPETPDAAPQDNDSGPYPGPEGVAAEPTPVLPTQLGAAAPTPITPPTFAVTRPTTSAPPTSQIGYPAPGDGIPVPDEPEPTDPPSAGVVQPTRAASQPSPVVTRPTSGASQPPPQPTSPPAPPQPTDPPVQPQPAPTDPPEDNVVTPEQPKGPPAIQPTPATTVPAAPPVNVLRGDVRWTAAQSPVILGMDQQIAPGAALVIEPGVEVRMLPGVAIYADGAIFALGQPGNPVRFVNHEGQRWDGIYGRPGSTLSFENTEIRGGGTGGTVLASEGGALAVRNSRITDNGGHVLVQDSRLEVRDTEIAGNDMPYGAAIEATYINGGSVTLTGNRIGGNRMSAGAPPVQVNNQNVSAVNLDIQGNLLIGQTGPNLVLSTNGALQGDLTCNTWINGTNGLSIRSQTTQVPGFALNIRDNATEDHTPPIIPIYLEYGIGRGATSEVELDMRNNWWDNPLGPYDPERHADGRGDAVGDNIAFEPWLTARPACAPLP